MRVVEVPESWISSIRIVTDVTTDDVEQFLTPREKADIDVLRTSGRRLERAASRVAGKILLADVYAVGDPSEIEFTKRGDRPTALLRGDNAPFSISFTHSGGFGAAAAGRGPVGVDLETFRPIRSEMTRFFLSADELASATNVELDHPLLHYWSAKEAAFKLDDRFPTLLRTPLAITSSSTSGLTFDITGTSFVVETRIIEGSFVAALARPLG